MDHELLARNQPAVTSGCRQTERKRKSMLDRIGSMQEAVRVCITTNSVALRAYSMLATGYFSS
jgi:hypothetical protein